MALAPPASDPMAKNPQNMYRSKEAMREEAQSRFRLHVKSTFLHKSRETDRLMTCFES